jgi:uncharacterized membrane protein YdjX (TVP38/TMEM64 family)
VEGFFTDLGGWIAELGTWAYLVAPLVMMLVAVLPIPAELPAMANGMLFGPVIGTLISWTGSMLGAWISYEIAHAWGRPIAERMVSKRVLLEIDRAADDAGWWGLMVLRLIPVVAFTALNWGAGLCVVPRRRFLWTTAVGIVPGAILFTTSGVGIGALWARSPAMAAGLTVIVLAALASWGLRRRARMA